MQTGAESGMSAAMPGVMTILPSSLLERPRPMKCSLHLTVKRKVEEEVNNKGQSRDLDLNFCKRCLRVGWKRG